ncbi:MAG: PadR family transcriptional regulator [Parcubacteria group bacterium]|nr:MAG: PadR family transcriptional regulator [Parcubacteria group bacterium]
MTKKENGQFIGHWEELILLTAATLSRRNKLAYGASIAREITRSTSRRANVGSISQTIARLQLKGLVRTELDYINSHRGARIRLVRVLPAGRKALRLCRQRHQDILDLWATISRSG